jgi:hypothetical protein
MYGATADMIPAVRRQADHGRDMSADTVFNWSPADLEAFEDVIPTATTCEA